MPKQQQQAGSQKKVCKINCSSFSRPAVPGPLEQSPKRTHSEMRFRFHPHLHDSLNKAHVNRSEPKDVGWAVCGGWWAGGGARTNRHFRRSVSV